MSNSGQDFLVATGRCGHHISVSTSTHSAQYFILQRWLIATLLQCKTKWHSPASCIDDHWPYHLLHFQVVVPGLSLRNHTAVSYVFCSHFFPLPKSLVATTLFFICLMMSCVNLPLPDCFTEWSPVSYTLSQVTGFHFLFLNMIPWYIFITFFLSSHQMMGV